MSYTDNQLGTTHLVNSTQDNGISSVCLRLYSFYVLSACFAPKIVIVEYAIVYTVLIK